MVQRGLRIILASASCRRLQILEEQGFSVVVRPADILEVRQQNEAVTAYVTRLAIEKARAVLIESNKTKAELLLAADTVVAFDEVVLEKPCDHQDASRMLSMLSGKTHKVYTGYALVGLEQQKWLVDYAETQVTFRALTPQQIEDYIITHEPFDKSGSYGIQQVRDSFIEDVQGSYYNVMGLPIEVIKQHLPTLLP